MVCKFSPFVRRDVANVWRSVCGLILAVGSLARVAQGYAPPLADTILAVSVDSTIYLSPMSRTANGDNVIGLGGSSFALWFDGGGGKSCVGGADRRSPVDSWEDVTEGSGGS
jgi:hypothetical protein